MGTGGRCGEMKASGLCGARGGCIEQSFALLYESVAMQRTLLRGRNNIRKRILIHASAFNLSLVSPTTFAMETP